MRTWQIEKEKIKSISDNEKRQIDLTVELVAKITEQRNLLGISQRELAKKTGLKQSAISRLEKCRALPSIETLSTVANALDLKLQLIPNVSKE